MNIGLLSKRSICILLFITIGGCVHLVSYYDSLSYKNLTDLKAEMRVFFESCKINNIATGPNALKSINDFVLTSAKAYEYEKGKKVNDDTISQLAIIEKTVLDVKSRYEKNKVVESKCKARADDETPDEQSGCLSKGYCLGKWRVFESAFDIAIATEQSKLKAAE